MWLETSHSPSGSLLPLQDPPPHPCHTPDYSGAILDIASFVCNYIPAPPSFFMSGFNGFIP